MKFKRLLALLLAIFTICTQLPVMAADEAATFTVTSVTPEDGARNVPIYNAKVDVTFSEPVDASTLTMATISITGSAFRSAVLTNPTSATIYLDREALKAGEKYTITLKNGIKAVSGASLTEKKITLSISREVPSFRQISNQGLDDPNFLSGFIGDTKGNISVVNDNGNNVLKFVTPGWNEGALKTNPLIKAGKTYKGRLRFKLETASEAWLVGLIYQPGNADFYRDGERQLYEANTWYTIESTWSIPDDTELDKFQFLFAVFEPNIVAYIDDIHFFEVGDDNDPPVEVAGGSGSQYVTVSESNTAFNKFKAFGIIPRGAEADGTISRIDLANALLKLEGLTELPVVTSTKFTDVSEADMATVQSVVDIGLMNGAGDTVFEPSEKVTMDQVIKTLVNLMGWGEVAQQNGGYPGGYNKVAADLGLLNNVNPEAGTKFTYDDFATVLNNALDKEVLNVLKYNGTIDAHFLVPDGTFLDTFLKYGYSSGVIEGNKNTFIYQDGNLADGYVQIDGTMYSCDADLQEYLGYEVSFYFEESVNNEPPRIKYITGLSKNTVYEFDTETSYIDFQDNSYYVAADGQRKPYEYELTNNKNVIYNGKYWGEYKNNADSLVPGDGSVKIIDSGDGFATVVITDIRTVFVDAVDYTNETIFDSKKSLPSISLEDCDEPVIEDYDGGLWSLEDIVEGNVISVIQSKDGELTHIYLSTKTTAGPVASISTDGDKSEIVVGDEFYGTIVRTSYDVVDNYFDINEISNASVGTFYLDWRGKIAAFTVGTISNSVGYLVNAAVNTSSLDTVVDFKIYASNGKMIYLKSAEKFTIDTTRIKNAQKAIELLSKGTSEVVPQLILYKTDRDGLVTFIDTAYNKVPNTENYNDVTVDSKDNKDGFRVTYSSLMRDGTTATDSLLTDYNNDAVSYSTFRTSYGATLAPDGYTFGNQVHLSKNPEPMFFTVPWKDANDVDEKRFLVKRGSPWDVGNRDSVHLIEAYQIDAGSYIADYVVVAKDTSKGAATYTNSSPRGVITSIKTVSKDEQNVLEITLHDNNKYYDRDGMTAGYVVGDVCTLVCDQDRYIDRIDKMYDVKSNTLLARVGDFGSSWNGYNRICLADVYEKKGSIVKVITTDPNAKEEYINLSGATTIAYNRLKDEVMTASTNEILSYDNVGDDMSRILIISRYAQSNLVYIVD